MHQVAVIFFPVHHYIMIKEVVWAGWILLKSIVPFPEHDLVCLQVKFVPLPLVDHVHAWIPLHNTSKSFFCTTRPNPYFAQHIKSFFLYSLWSEIIVGDFVLSTKFVLSHWHLFPIGGSTPYPESFISAHFLGFSHAKLLIVQEFLHDYRQACLLFVILV
jgi:hypothetical protein